MFIQSKNLAKPFDMRNFLIKVADEYINSDKKVTPHQIFTEMFAESYKVDKAAAIFDIERFQSFINNVTSGNFHLFSSKLCTELKKTSNALVEAYRNYINALDENHLFVSDTKIAMDYLNAYSEVLKVAYHCKKEIAKEGSNYTSFSNFFFYIQSFGSDFNLNCAVNEISPYAPVIVSLLYRFMLRIKYIKFKFVKYFSTDFCRMIYMESDVNNLIDNAGKTNMLVKMNKDQSIFFGYLNFDFEGCACVIQNPAKKVSRTFLPPISYAEQIAREFNKWKKKNLDGNTLKIGIIGEIANGSIGVLENITDFEETILALIGTDLNKKYKIVIDFYTNTFGSIEKFYTLGNGSVSIEISLHENDFFDSTVEDEFSYDFFDSYLTKLNDFISAHELIFFVDCAGMYKSPHTFKSQYDDSNAERYLDQNCKTFDEPKNGYLSFNNYYTMGIAWPKETFVTHKYEFYMDQNLYNHVSKNSSSDKSVYVYSNAYNDLSEKDRATYITYNGSKGYECYLLNNSDAQIELTNPEKIIVFTLYDVLQITNLRLIGEDVIRRLFYNDSSKHIVRNADVIKHLKGVYIGIKYDLSERGKLNILVYYDKKCFEEKEMLVDFEHIQNNVMEFVKGFFEDYFGDPRKNISDYSTYMPILERSTKFRSNFLFCIIMKYSMSIEDILLLHWMNDKNLYDNPIMKFEISQKDISTSYINSEGMANYKLKFYREIMKGADQTKNSFGYNDYIYESLEKFNMSVRGFCQNIRLLCEQYGYAGSYLDENMESVEEQYCSVRLRK